MVAYSIECDLSGLRLAPVVHQSLPEMIFAFTGSIFGAVASNECGDDDDDDDDDDDTNDDDDLDLEPID